MTPPRTGRHDREHIIGIALELLDRYGLPDLTMRRLATELDVQASALYWHFDSKQDLLAAVSDRILARIPEPVEGEPLIDVARSVRDALLAHRDGAEIVISSAALRPGRSRAHEMLLRALPASLDDPGLAATAVLQFVLGHTTLAQQRMHGESHGAARTTDVLDEDALDAAVFETGIALFSLGTSPAMR